MSFCTNCGTELDDDASFCTNCGTKVVEHGKKPKGLFDTILEFQTNGGDGERKNAIKEVQRIIGVGNNFNDAFLNELKRNGLERSDGKRIKDVMLRETRSGKIKSDDVRNRVDELLLIRKEHKEFDKNRIKYLEDFIKDSYPNIKLATFEEEYINNVELYFDESPNSIAKRIINTHEKIGEYDFAGKLIEEAGLTNRVDIIGLNKSVRKEPDYSSYVFLKICDEHLKIVGSDIKTINLNTRLGIDMTIFFRDIISVNYATDWRNNGEIKFDLNNRKFKLIAYKEDEKYLEEFYKLLNNKWIKSKNNETVNTSSTHKNEVTSADELMKYAELYEKGLLSEDEFNAIKKKLLQL